MANPLDYIQTAAPIVGSALSFLGANSANKQNLDEAAINRQFQERMMDKANDFTEKMWRVNNAYNSIASQMERMRNAGLNPNLAYDNAAPIAGPSPVGSAASGGAQAVVRNPVEDANIGKTLAETDFIRSQTNKTNAEASNEWTKAKYAEERESGVIKMQGVTIRLTEQKIKTSAAQENREYVSAMQLRASAEDLLASAAYKRVMTDVANVDLDLKKIERSFSTEFWTAKVKKLQEEARITYMQAETFMRSFVLDSLVKMSQANANNSHARLNDQLVKQSEAYTSNLESYGVQIGIENDQLQFDLDLDKKYGDKERRLGLNSGRMNLLRSGIQGFNDWLDLFTGRKFAGSILGAFK